MKKFLTLLVTAVMVFMYGSALFAQNGKPVLNHIAIYVKDLKVSTAFYMDVIDLDTIPEPFHDHKHTWFSVSDNSHLHIIEGAKAITDHDKNSHLCFSVPDVENVTNRLKSHSVAFENWAGDQNQVTTRVDGIKQIYFKDPDGYWIEINNDYPKAK
jgi:lactoylglutathione lyase